MWWLENIFQGYPVCQVILQARCWKQLLYILRPWVDPDACLDSKLNLYQRPLNPLYEVLPPPHFIPKPFSLRWNLPSNFNLWMRLQSQGFETSLLKLKRSHPTITKWNHLRVVFPFNNIPVSKISIRLCQSRKHFYLMLMPIVFVLFTGINSIIFCNIFMMVCNAIISLTFCNRIISLTFYNRINSLTFF